jgi:predicted flap endonuclease-1-like 5' DNA nuclease
MATPDECGAACIAVVGELGQTRRTLASARGAVELGPDGPEDGGGRAQDGEAIVTEDKTRDRLAVDLTGSEPDDLTRIRGLSASLARRFADRGIVRFAQIAAWSAEDVRTIAAAFGLGREISRRNWIEQAALLELRRAGAQRPIERADARAVELRHVLEHIRAAAALQGRSPPAEAPADGAGSPARGPAVEPAQPGPQEDVRETPDGPRGGEAIGWPAPEAEEASVTFIIRELAPLPLAGGAPAQGGATPGQAGPPTAPSAESGAEEPLLLPLDGEVEEAEVVIVSRRTPEGRSRQS